MHESKPKRSKILIDPQVQWSLALRILLHWGMLVICLLMINSMIALLMMAGHRPLSGAFGDVLRDQVPLMVVLVVLLPVFLRDTLKMSNRFAGPMYRLRTTLAKMARGESVSAINFRQGDFWQEVAADFNTVTAKYEQTLARNKQLEAELAQLREQRISV